MTDNWINICHSFIKCTKKHFHYWICQKDSAHYNINITIHVQHCVWRCVTTISISCILAIQVLTQMRQPIFFNNIPGLDQQHKMCMFILWCYFSSYSHYFSYVTVNIRSCFPHAWGIGVPLTKNCYARCYNMQWSTMCSGLAILTDSFASRLKTECHHHQGNSASTRDVLVSDKA